MADAQPVSASTAKKKYTFRQLNNEEKQKILDNRMAKNTKNATKLWIGYFKDFLQLERLPDIDSVNTDELQSILENFSGLQISPDQSYKNSSLKCIRAAVNWYFKETRSLDIISNPHFIRCNELFKGILKIGKENGYGDVDSKAPICEEDMSQLKKYFENNMATKFGPYCIQETLLFHIIFFMGRRGRENLRAMSKDTFAVRTDPDGRKYIYQAEWIWQEPQWNRQHLSQWSSHLWNPR